VIIEVKASKAIDPAHEAQLLNYLKATRLKLGLILNFGTPRSAPDSLSVGHFRRK
jgi:GxxExxY protein